MVVLGLYGHFVLYFIRFVHFPATISFYIFCKQSQASNSLSVVFGVLSRWESISAVDMWRRNQGRWQCQIVGAYLFLKEHDTVKLRNGCLLYIFYK